MNIAVVGYGVEGKASYRYFSRAGHDVTIVDERASLQDVPEGAGVISGEHALDSLNGFDMVIRTPALRPDRIVTDGVVWSATNEFFAKCPAPIIGVTGTKGKGTTCSLIAAILRAAGKTVHLVGNIGVPALDALPEITADDIVVYELSSFQLWDLQRSPQTAVVLPIEPDHLDIHGSFEEYIAAKANISSHQGANDEIIYHRFNNFSVQIANMSPATTRREYPFEIGSLAEALRIPGAHNRENATAAIAAVASYVSDVDVIGRGLAAFDGLPHRLKFVGEKHNVSFYDDSISTTPGSAIAAMASFDGPKVIILGGSDKGVRYEDVVLKCAETSTRVVTMGQTGGIIDRLCRDRGIEARRADNMREAVHIAYEFVRDEGGVVILSPASASFDMYANYSDRGDRFIAEVRSL